MTKRLFSDQVLYRLYGGIPDPASAVDERDIWKALEQLINAALKLSQFTQNLPSGETMPENLQIGIYENIAVISTTLGKSKAIMPTMPISLPRNMGIYQIYNSDFPDSPFIPIQAGQTALLKTDTLLSDILGQISYEPKGKTIYFNVDLPLYGITELTMELVCMDISLYGVNDMLPLPSDMEAGIVEQLVKMFNTVLPESGNVNPYTTQNSQVITNPSTIKR